MLISLQRIIKSGVTSFKRNSVLSLASVGVMTLTISALTIFMLIHVATKHIAETLRDKIDISVYLALDAKEEDIRELRKELERLSPVKYVEYISREEALSRFKDRYKNNPVVLEALKEVERNPLPPSLNIKAYQASQYEAISKFLSEDKFQPLVSKVNYYENKQMIKRLFSLTNVISNTGLIINIVLGIIALLVAFNTVRLAIYNLRDEIAVMRLVGAGNWFIRGPFIVMGTISGVIAAAIAMTLFYMVAYYLSPKIEAFIPGLSLWAYYNANIIVIFSMQIAVGVGIGVISSIIAMNKYLKI